MLVDTIKLPTAETDAKIYVVSYTDRIKKGEDVSSLKRTSPELVGAVLEKNLPKEGGMFRMHYHRVAGILTFGVVYVPECSNVIVEDGRWYFESKEEGKCYLMTLYKAS